MQNKTVINKHRWTRFFEWLVIAIFLAITALRCTITQAPGVVSSIGDNIYNIVCAFALMFIGTTAFVLAMMRKFKYRITWIEAGFVVFAVTAIVSAIFASNKRLAINQVLFLTGPMIMAMLLVQLLTTPARMKTALYVIVAVAASNVVECIDQVNSSNDMVIKQYQQDPNFVISRLNIEPGSYQQMLFQHRIYSKDVRGFFTTGNSAGSFFVLALAACCALVIEKRSQLELGAGSTGELAGRIIVAVAIIIGLILTHSKGAALAAIIAFVIWAIWAKAGDWLRRYRWFVFFTFVAAILIAFAAVVEYGLKHNTLPGGNSMLVRWQYWTGALKAFAAHPIIGVGGDNFAPYYQLYKDPAALETVRDPHNFILSILVQFGPAGLVGFLAAVFAPLLAVIFSKSDPLREHKKAFTGLMLFVILITCVVLTVVRPMLIDIDKVADRNIVLFVTFWLFGLPIVIFLAGMWVLSIKERLSISCRAGQIAIVCGIAGVLVHNLVDFAIFEPGIYTSLWVMIAVAVSIGANSNTAKQLELKPGNMWGSVGVVVAFAAIWAVTFFCVGPVIRTGVLTTSAMNSISLPISLVENKTAVDPNILNKVVKGSFAAADANMSRAVLDDKYSSEIPVMQAAMALRIYELPDQNDLRLLQWAKSRYLLAAERDNADFKNYSLLSDVLVKLAGAQPELRTGYLSQAAVAINEAIKRYPGSDKLYYDAGHIAELRSDPNAARKYFAQAVRIEDDYRRMFVRMYPGRKIFSRLGEAKYRYAKSRLTP